MNPGKATVGIRSAWSILFLLAAAALIAFSLTLVLRDAHAAVPAAPAAQNTQQPDVYEPNDTAATARGFLTGSPVVSLTFSTQSGNSGADEDWYTVVVAANTTLTLTGLVEGTSAILQLTAFEDNGTTQVAQGQSSTSSLVAIVNQTNSSRFFRVRVSNTTPGTPNARYQVTFVSTSNTFATVTPVAGQAAPDVYEINDLPSTVLSPTNGGAVRSFLFPGGTFPDTQRPNFYSTAPIGSIREAGDVDWYFFFGRAGGRYRVTTVASPGVDTELFIYRESAALAITNNLDQSGIIADNDDYQPLDRSSRIEFTADYEGRHWLKIWNKDPAPRVGGSGYNPNYNVVVQEIGSSATVTPALPTPFPQGIDRFEYNGDLESAALIAPGLKYEGLNFVPFRPLSRDVVDNDFFKLPVKQGVYYTCETLDLAGGTDTNIIVYNQNATMSTLDSTGIGGNNDISEADKRRGNFASRLTWLSNYNGYAYVVVGDVTPPFAFESVGRNYSLQCTIGQPLTPTPTVDPRGTPTPRPTFAPPTDAPPEPTFTPFPTPRSETRLVVRPVDGSGAPQASATPQPPPRTIALDVQVFNDINRNGLNDAGEGVGGASVRLSDEASGVPLSQAVTDTDGRVRFQIRNNTPVKVSIPLFGYSTIVDTPSAVVRLALVPAAQLPDRLP